MGLENLWKADAVNCEVVSKLWLYGL